MKRILFSALALVILGALLFSLPVQAQVTRTDIVLTGQYDGGKVYLKWSGIPPDSVKITYLYRSLGGPMSAVVRIDSTTKNEYVDLPPSTIKPPIVYTVSSVLKSGAVKVSNAVSVGLAEIVTITSVPTMNGIVNTLYTYQVMATSTKSGVTLKYVLAAKPERMTIDSVSGLVKWTPTARGSFKVAITVTSSAGARAEQGFTINVTGPAGTVEGFATGPSNEPVANVAVLLVAKTATNTPQYKIYTDRSGKYTINPVDSGLYLARAIPTSGNYAEQWYDGVTSQERATSFVVRPNSATTVNFKLTAKLDVIQIISRPPELASTGVLWTYQVLASSTDPTVTLKYQLGTKPDGMTIDSVKGLVKWTPSTKGAFKVGIVVASSRGARGEQSFTVTVSGPKGTVSGVVKDTLDKPVAAAYIVLYRGNGVQATTAKAGTDSAGKYSIAGVDSGRYFVRAVPTRGNFVEQWYDGATTLDKATAVIVLPNATTTVNITLKVKPVPLQFTVRGSVLDDAKKVPREATVTFTAPSPTVGSATGVIAPEVAYKVRVDSIGKYSIKLPQNTYTVMASAFGFAPTYYNGKTDILTANPLKLTKDTSSIDFVLKTISPGATGKISGSVLDSAGAGLRAKIVVYRLTTTKPVLDGPGAYPGEADSTGKFTVANLVAGNYIVLAMPLGPFAPTYFSQSGSTTNWERATKISINGNSVAGIKIVAQPLVKGLNGLNTINGVVSVNGESVQSMGSQGAAGAIVYAMLNTVDVAGYGIASESGNFSIEELDPGQYTLVVDKVNFTSITTAKANSVFNTSLDAMNPAPTAYLMLSPTVVTGTDENPLVPTELVLEQNYPNPFNPRTAISFQLTADRWMTLKVYDLLGREISVLVNGVATAGRHTVVWNGQNDRGDAVSSGVYLYRLTVGSSVVTRRMVLLK